LSLLSFSRRFSFQFFLLSALGLAPLHAQDNQPHTATLTVNARLVVLDLVVRDKNGKPVTDLTRDDFRVFEDGVLQPVRSFEPPSAHMLPPASAASAAATVYDPAQPASFGQSAVTVLVLDQLNTHFADSSFARRSLRDYLLKQPEVLAQPTSLLTVYEHNFAQLQGFSRDRSVLLKALEAAPVHNAWTLEASNNADYGPIERLDQSLHDLEQIAQSYAGIPGRKNLIWVGGGFPSVDPTSLDSHDLQIVQDTVQHITDVLLSTRVTLYAIDPSSSAAGVVEITNADMADAASAIGSGLGTNAGTFDANADFDHLSLITGGRVVRGRNDVGPQIALAIDDGASFYTIGYSPSSNSTSAAQFRKIRVDCLRPGLTMVTRAGYFAETVQQQKTVQTASYDLSTAAESKLQLNGLHVTASPETSVSTPVSSFVVHVSAPSLDWTRQEDGSSIASVYVLGVSLDAKGKIVDHIDHPMVATAKSGANLRDDSRTADFLITLPVSAKAARLRFVVRDSATGRMGSTDLPVKH
jgi:VWFA-related protein